MAASSAGDPTLQRDLISDLQSFFGDSDDTCAKQLSLADRTQCALVLLQSLPCTKYAVLEKIGEVFMAVAHSYIIQTERGMLAGDEYPIDVLNDPLHEQLVNNIRDTLVCFVDNNPDSWAPDIARWSVNLIGLICGQYGTKRGFAKFSIEERLQLWMNCCATRTLVSIANCCFGKIIVKLPDVCVDCLLEAAGQYDPFFDWALAQISCTFLDVMPQGMLTHALEAFSLQAKNAEIVINTVMSIYGHIIKKHKDIVKRSIINLFKISVSGKAANKDEEHIAHCTLPFLLHVSSIAPSLANCVAEECIHQLTPSVMAMLYDQSMRRDSVLQRGLLSRILELLKKLTSANYQVVQFLLTYACEEDDNLLKFEADVAMEVKRVCQNVLEFLIVELYDDVCVRHLLCSQSNNSVAGFEEEAVVLLDNPFLQVLTPFTKQLCAQYLQAAGTRKDCLCQLLLLVGLQNGTEFITQMLCNIFLKSQSKSDLKAFATLHLRFESVTRDLLPMIVNGIMVRLLSTTGDCHASEALSVIKSFVNLLSDTSKDIYSKPPMTLWFDALAAHFAHLTKLLGSNSNDVSDAVIDVLELLHEHVHTLKTAQHYAIARSLSSYFFKSLMRMSRDESCASSVAPRALRTASLLQLIIKANPDVRLAVICQFIELIFDEDYSPLFGRDADHQHPQGRKKPGDHWVSLLDKNRSIEAASRLCLSTTSVIKAGTLNKRTQVKDGQGNGHQDLSQFCADIYLHTLYSLLIFKIKDEKTSDKDGSVPSSFASLWLQNSSYEESSASFSYLAKLLTELTCPEVVSNGTWPDEETVKHSIERDLTIKKQFDRKPILYDLLLLISRCPSALPQCIVLVQSILATLLTHWSIDRKATANQSPQQLRLTRLVILVLAQAKWLSPPVCNVGQILHYLSPKEIHAILSGVWGIGKSVSAQQSTDVNMQVPGKDDRDVGRYGTDGSVTSLLCVIKEILAANIQSLGPFYARFFPDFENTL